MFNNSKTKKIRDKNKSDYQKYQEMVFKDYYTLKNSDSFISFDQIKNQLLIINHISEDDLVTVQLFDEAQKHFLKHEQLIYRDFVLGWTRNPRFSLTQLIPSISDFESSNVLSFNINTSKDKRTDFIISQYNDLITRLLKENNPIEILKDVILYFDSNTKKIKVFFAPGLIKDEFEKLDF
ncbi:DUF2714 domain-containing protein [Mycoplasmopsis ciconiae]|uniref:DUF2714 domain-containing protein n=1 Tax=Mycoplasmopsis ciconiae TaxID=561067 RepID=A0ABU7MMG8_9BACT|nr:DUF2714 domain-containing protein [Mycoplasmopsis ciconiae]